MGVSNTRFTLHGTVQRNRGYPLLIWAKSGAVPSYWTTWLLGTWKGFLFCFWFFFTSLFNIQRASFSVSSSWLWYKPLKKMRPKAGALTASALCQSVLQGLWNSRWDRALSQIFTPMETWRMESWELFGRSREDANLLQILVIRPSVCRTYVKACFQTG